MRVKIKRRFLQFDQYLACVRPDATPNTLATN